MPEHTWDSEKEVPFNANIQIYIRIRKGGFKGQLQFEGFLLTFWSLGGENEFVDKLGWLSY